MLEDSKFLMKIHSAYMLRGRGPIIEGKITLEPPQTIDTIKIVGQGHEPIYTVVVGLQRFCKIMDPPILTDDWAILLPDIKFEDYDITIKDLIDDEVYLCKSIIKSLNPCHL